MCELQKSSEFGFYCWLVGFKTQKNRHNNEMSKSEDSIISWSFCLLLILLTGRDPFRSIHFHPLHHLSPSALRLGADRLPIIAKMRMQLAEITPRALQMFHLLCPRLTFCSRWVTSTRPCTHLPLLLQLKKKEIKNN